MEIEMSEGSRQPRPSATTSLSRDDNQDAVPSEQNRERRLPEDYAAAVSKFSVRTQQYSLHPGIHFRSLALFLTGKSYTTPSSVHQRAGLRDHSFVVIHDLGYERHDPRRVASFDSLQGLVAFLAHPSPRKDCGQLLFLRGYPSHHWANTIGSRYQIDPEIFRRHLTPGHKHGFYDLPGPGSLSHNIIKLSITSLGTGYANTLGRQDEPRVLHEYSRLLGTNQEVVGESLVRKFNVHDEEHFSIEQDISISVVKRGEGWLALIILDNGRDLDEGPQGPWQKVDQQTRKFDDVFFPVIQFEPGICFKDQGRAEIEPTSQQSSALSQRPSFQSASLLPSPQYGRFLSSQTMKADAFYALTDIFTFCASSEHQFLNFLSVKFDSRTRPEEDQEQMAISVRDLRCHKSILQEHIEGLRTILACVRSRGNPKWPRLKSPIDPSRRPSAGQASTSHFDAQAAHASQLAKSQAAADMLVEVYEGLLRRAETLWQLHRDGIEDIRTSAALAESRKATRNAEGVARLTFLAFLFLPLSFTTSLFGMNFRELGAQNDLSIWIWVVASVPVFIFALVLCFWSHVASSFLTACRQARHGLRRARKPQ